MSVREFEHGPGLIFGAHIVLPANRGKNRSVAQGRR